jgi:hypothetical protein
MRRHHTRHPSCRLHQPNRLQRLGRPGQRQRQHGSRLGAGSHLSDREPGRLLPPFPRAVAFFQDHQPTAVNRYSHVRDSSDGKPGSLPPPCPCALTCFQDRERTAVNRNTDGYGPVLYRQRRSELNIRMVYSLPYLSTYRTLYGRGRNTDGAQP